MLHHTQILMGPKLIIWPKKDIFESRKNLSLLPFLKTKNKFRSTKNEIREFLGVIGPNRINYLF